jgi:hypothetical protein
MFKYKNAVFCAWIMISALCLSGCSFYTFNPTVNSLFIKRDYTIVSAEIETLDNSAFDEERYSADSLRTFVEDEVKQYNKDTCGLELAYLDDLQDKKNTTLPVSIQEIKYEDSTAKLLLRYQDASAYLGFNDHPLDGGVTNIMIGRVSELLEKDIEFPKMEDTDGNAVEREELEINNNYYVVTITGSTHVHVEGEIEYVSPGVTVTQKHEADTPSDTESFIIFR